MGRLLASWEEAHGRGLARVFFGLLACDVAHRLISLSAGVFPLQFDSWSYWTIAKGLVDGGGFLLGDPTGLRPPVYPGFVACCQIVGSRWALEMVVVAQHVLGIGTALMVGQLCRGWSESRILGLLGYALVAAGFGRIQLDHQVMSESLFIFLLTLHLWLLARLLKCPGASLGFVAGVALGIATLTRPLSLFLILPEVLLVLMFQRTVGRARYDSSLRACAVMVVAFLLALVTWSVRNFKQFGELSITRISALAQWENTFRSKGAGLALPVRAAWLSAGETDWRSGWQVSSRLRRAGWPEEELEDWMNQTVRTARREQSSEYWGATLKNAVRFWTDVEEAIPFYSRSELASGATFENQKVWNKPAIWRPFEGLLKSLYRFPWQVEALAALLAMSGCAALLTRRDESALLGWILIVWMGYFCAVTVLAMYPLYRYRAVLQPAMVVGGVLGLGPVGLRAITEFRLGWVRLASTLGPRKPPHS